MFLKVYEKGLSLVFDKQKQKLTRQDQQTVVKRRAEIEIVRHQILSLRHRVLDPH